MIKKIIFILIGVFLFSSHLASASLIINEFMYDLDGADIDWVEVYNSDNDVDLSTIKLFISNSTSNHGIVNYSGSQVLSRGEYGVIVPTSKISAFTSKWGNSGNLFTSSFTLPNVEDQETAKIEINDGDKNSPISSVIYDESMGAKGDGNSLQLINDLWKPASPTPGLVNEDSVVPPPTGGRTPSTSNQSTSEPEIKTNKISKLKTEIIAKKLAFVGFPVKFEANTTGHFNESLNYGKYFWNFGDGDSRETKVNYREKFTHTFFYESEYTVALEYYQNYYSNEPDASDKIIIKVVPVYISISRVGDEEDFFVEIFNDTNYNTDLSRWVLYGNNKNFVFPKNTIIQPKKKIILSPKITNFSVLDKDSLKLMNLQGEIVFDYLSSIEPIKKPVKKSISVKTSKVKPIQEKSENISENDTKIEIPTENLLANAVENNIPIKNNFIYEIGLVAFLGVSASGAYFIRSRNKKSVSVKAGDDFEIIDE